MNLKTGLHSFITSLTFSLCTHAQQPLNFDFETKSIEGTSRPWGWEIEVLSPGTKIAMDSINRHNGKYSMAITCNPATTAGQLSVISYFIESYAFAGEKIRFTGWLKLGSDQGTAFVATGISRDADENNINMLDTLKVVHNKNGGWQKITMNVQIPLKATSLVLKLMAEGGSNVWFDDFKLQVKNESRLFTEIAPEFTTGQLKWLKMHSSGFSSVDAHTPNAPPDHEFDVFKTTCGKASIIALGESTHGTSEFFRLKHRLLEYAVKSMGVRVFAIEANQVVGDRINNYIKGGPGDARSSMYGLFSVWQTQEVRDMIQWLREYNALHPNEKVEFAAFDIQDIKQPTDSLFAYLKTKNERLFDSVSTCLSELVQKPGDHFNASDTIKYKWMISADKAFQMVQSQKSSLLSDAKTWNDTLTVERNIQYANLVRQYARNLYLGHASLYRDTAMAENVSWILSIQPPGSKMLIWAHDMHISKGADPVRKNNMYNGISMGAHLAKKYGMAYKAFGLSTYKGSYWAQVSYTDFRMMDCPLLDAPRGSLDEALHRVSESYNNKLIFLDLTTARNEQWLIKPLPVRFANHVNIEYGYWSRYSVPYQFDGIFFIDSTSSARSYAK